MSGLVPGSALGCVIKKSDLENPEVCTISHILCTLSLNFPSMSSGPYSAVTQHATQVYVHPG